MFKSWILYFSQFCILFVSERNRNDLKADRNEDPKLDVFQIDIGRCFSTTEIYEHALIRLDWEKEIKVGVTHPFYSVLLSKQLFFLFVSIVNTI